jgi:hypothetical protein
MLKTYQAILAVMLAREEIAQRLVTLAEAPSTPWQRGSRDGDSIGSELHSPKLQAPKFKLQSPTFKLQAQKSEFHSSKVQDPSSKIRVL